MSDEYGDKDVFVHQCEIAKRRSSDGCTYHVNAVAGLVDGVPRFLRFYVTDWYSSDSTLMSFKDGRQRE